MKQKTKYIKLPTRKQINKPARTMLTSEATSNRSTHIVETKKGARFLSPIECERLNGFDDNWTKGMPNRARYFTMGKCFNGWSCFWDNEEYWVG